MARGLILALLLGHLFCGVVHAQNPPDSYPEPPEEDESLAPKEYAFNPVQAKKELSAGDFYMKKGNYTAAARRYLEATRWDNGSAEAFLRLGEASEQAHDYLQARTAFNTYFTLADDPKTVQSIKKRMAKWPKKATATSQQKETQPLDSVPNLNPPPPRSHRWW